MNDRLMKTEKEVRQRAKELLQLRPEDLLTQYMFQEQEIERLNNIIEIYKDANEYHQNIIHELETMKQPNQLYGENVILRAENNKLNKRIKELEEGFKATTEDLCEESTKIEKAIEYIKKHTYHDKPKKLQNGIYERGILLIKSDFDIEELLELLDKGE